jgi:hypothetical protein
MAGEASQQIFVAYPYEFSEADYRKVFGEISEKFSVEFIYADAQITNKHILEKIVGMIESSAFSLFDITTWNANVALELGVAVGAALDYYILFNPTAGKDANVPADLGGIDRIQYSDYTELGEGLDKLMTQQFGSPDDQKQPRAGGDFSVQLETLQAEIPDKVGQEPGMQIGGIASAIGVPLEHAQVLVRPLVGETLVTRGAKRGTRYYLPDDAPPEDEELTPAEGLGD